MKTHLIEKKQSLANALPARPEEPDEAIAKTGVSKDTCATRIAVMCLLFFVNTQALYNGVRQSSWPYISGDTLREQCDYKLDDDSHFKPQEVTKPSLIFVQSEFLSEFFEKIHPALSAPYVLVTHNSDMSVPGAFISYLEDEKLIGWFGHNPSCTHAKFTAIPIGIANQFWPHGNKAVFDAAILDKNNCEKETLVYVNFSQCDYHGTDPDFIVYSQERSQALAYLQQQNFVNYAQRKELASYLKDLGSSSFVACPRGHGLDTHRIWEALLMGSIPIVKSSDLDQLLSSLPVMIIKDWTDLTQESLVAAYADINSRTYNLSKLYAEYWLDLMRKALKQADKISQMPEPYRSTRTLSYLGHGFFIEGNRRNLEEIIKQYNPKIVVELGSWLGASTMYIASQIKKNSVLYAVDTWCGSPEHATNPEWNRLLPTLYVQFLSNVKHKQLTDKIVPVKMTTLEAARDLSVIPNLVYMDASHEEEAVYNDIIAWYPKLAPGGIMCGDDWAWPSVARAVGRASQELKQAIIVDDNFWQFMAKT